MKPTVTLGEVRTPGGSHFALQEHDGEYILRLDGAALMSSSWTTSEVALADSVCAGMREDGRVLIGGLGLGFSLKRVLELVGKPAKVVQAELIPDVAEWNREHLMGVNGALLGDPRVELVIGDVFDLISGAGPNPYDAILLDVDNGPTSFVQPQNARLYRERGLAMIRRALREGGKVGFWSAVEEPKFLKQLRGAGFKVEEIPVKMHARAKRAAHRIYVGEKS